MSIFSGFPTRKLQERYNNLIKDTLNMLMQMVITYIQRDKTVPFQAQFKKVYHGFEKLDSMKHTQMKLSQILRPLAEHLSCIDDCLLASDVRTEPKQTKRRPLTSNYLIKQQKKNNQLQRKTINLAAQYDIRNSRSRYNKPKRYSVSVKNSVQQKKPFDEFDLSPDISMEELMQKNRLVERKMSLFRKKKFMQQEKIHKIQEQEQQEEDIGFK